ncbi:MAG: tetratricopeptide repeat protein, partial [Deltaproteobacteria bacterium]|nr:tetratricopeptide repeat protein [Deltaproteobacteria bacterium]
PGPSAQGYWLDRAEALSKARDLPGLLDHVHRLVQAEPKNPAAWFNLGVAHDQLGRWREAADAFREALRLKPDLAEAWTCLALAYALSGNRTAALQALKELRRYDPGKADKLFDLIMGR